MAEPFEDEDLFDDDEVMAMLAEILGSIADLMVEETLESAFERCTALLFWCWAEGRCWIDLMDEEEMLDELDAF